MISKGAEEATHRAVWNEPNHHMFHVGIRQDGVLRVLLERDIKHVISEGIFPDTHHPDESEYVTEVRGLRDAGVDGIRRMQILLEDDGMNLLIEHIHDTTGQEHPGWISDSLFRMWREQPWVLAHGDIQ